MHLPVYTDNAYQPLLMQALQKQGIEVLNGGSGGNFFRTALLKWRADILHFHWLHPYLLRSNRIATVFRATRFLAELTLLRRAGARLVWTVHNLANHDSRYVRFERLFSRRFATRVDGIIVHSHSALAPAKLTFRLSDSVPIAVIPQGSYFGCYQNDRSRAECRRQLGLEVSHFVFVFLGRIEPYKGVLDLIRTFHKMPEQAQLLIAGRISDADSSKLIHEAIGGAANIRLHKGFVADENLQVFLNAADAYVYPAPAILNSGSIWLAMSFGLPCVAPQNPGLLEALGTRGGIFYSPAEPGSLLEAMLEAMRRKEQLREMGEKNRARANSWTWDKVAYRTMEVYERCLAL